MEQTKRLLADLSVAQQNLVVAEAKVEGLTTLLGRQLTEEEEGEAVNHAGKAVQSVQFRMGIASKLEELASGPPSPPVAT